MKKTKKSLDKEEFKEGKTFTVKCHTYGDDPNLSHEQLERLSEHTGFTNRTAVALNPSTPILVVIKLTHDKNEYVSNAAKAVIIAQASNVSEEELERLSEYPISEIRQAVAINANTAIEVVMKLTQDEDVQVANTAKKVIESRESEV